MTWTETPASELQTVAPLVMAMVIEQCACRVTHCGKLWAFGPVPEVDQRPLSAMVANCELTQLGNWFLYPREHEPSQPKTPSAGYFTEGEYAVEIVRCYLHLDRFGDVLVCIEAVVVDSSGITARRIRERCAQVIKFTQNQELKATGVNQLRTFLAAAGAGDNEDPVEALISSRLDGVRLSLRCQTLTTRMSGYFIHHQWRALEAMLLEDGCGI